MPDRMVISRWRARLKADDAFAATLAEAIEQCRAMCETLRGGGAHVSQNTGLPEWYTPKSIIEAARRVMGHIDCDPASHEDAQAVVQAATYYTARTNGLTHEWHGTVWMNPPYSQPLISQFCEKLCHELQERRTTQAITLTNNGTETEWGQRLLLASAAVCFPNGRVTFWNPTRESIPLQGQMVCYFGSSAEHFTEDFGYFGATFDRRV